jgi:hypothetical protein
MRGAGAGAGDAGNDALSWGSLEDATRDLTRRRKRRALRFACPCALQPTAECERLWYGMCLSSDLCGRSLKVFTNSIL